MVNWATKPGTWSLPRWELDPALPGLPLALLPPCGTAWLLALPSTCVAPRGIVSCWIIRLDWQTRNRQVHAKERRKEAPGKRQFRSAGEEPTPNLTSVKMRKRTTASHLNPNVLLTFLSYLDNSQNLLKHEEKKKIPLFPHSIHRNEVGLEMQLP